MVEYASECDLAEALYDNQSEWPDELAFHQGEILRVLDQKPANGLADGWWLCSDQRGNQGIAPANRLRLIHRIRNFGAQNRVFTPRRFGDVFLYNDSLFSGQTELFGPTFDITSHPRYDIPPGLSRFRLLHDSSHPVQVDQCSHSESGRQPVIHEVPIRIEGRDKDSTKRRSPPPPPQRRYFHNFSDPPEQDQFTSPQTTADNGSVHWRTILPGQTTTTNTTPRNLMAPERSSNASTLSVTPPGDSERDHP